MADKFQNRYRIASTRLPNWDYGSAGAYFVTICTQGRACYFGQVANGTVQLSAIGKMANQFWYEIKNHAPSVDLGAFVVMPNHVHGIIILNPDIVTVEARHALPLQQQPKQPQPPQQPITGQTAAQKRFRNPGENTVSSIVGSYKSAVSRQAHRLGYEFAWQSRFHDHIIRDEKSFQRISTYIENNPLNWREDEQYYI